MVVAQVSQVIKPTREPEPKPFVKSGPLSLRDVVTFRHTAVERAAQVMKKARAFLEPHTVSPDREIQKAQLIRELADIRHAYENDLYDVMPDELGGITTIDTIMVKENNNLIRHGYDMVRNALMYLEKQP